MECNEFGELKKLAVRKLWRNEAQDFTPWLVHEENILQLETSLEIEVEITEVSVGPYSADILTKDIRTDKYIVIENQLPANTTLWTFGNILGCGQAEIINKVIVG